MSADAGVRVVRDRVRRVPLPASPPPGPLERVAWLLLHRAVPMDPAVQAGLAERWGLSVPPVLARRAATAGTDPATPMRVVRARERLRRTAAACPAPPELVSAVRLAACAPWLSEAGLRQALAVAGLSEGDAGGPLLRALAGLWVLDREVPVVCPEVPGHRAWCLSGGCLLVVVLVVGFLWGSVAQT